MGRGVHEAEMWLDLFAMFLATDNTTDCWPGGYSGARLVIVD